MSNIHQLFSDALAPFAPPALRPFAVSIKTATTHEVIHVMSCTTCDAIRKAIDIFFDGDKERPICGFVVIARPLNHLPRSA